MARPAEPLADPVTIPAVRLALVKSGYPALDTTEVIGRSDGMQPDGGKRRARAARPIHVQQRATGYAPAMPLATISLYRSNPMLNEKNRVVTQRTGSRRIRSRPVHRT